MTDTTTYWTMIDSPLGPLLLTADEEGISGVIMDADLDEQAEAERRLGRGSRAFRGGAPATRGVLRGAADRVRPSAQGGGNTLPA